jgi:hypothetical protein
LLECYDVKALRSPDRAHEIRSSVCDSSYFERLFRRLRRFSRLTALQGDVVISSTSSPVWLMKKWAYYSELKNDLKLGGLKVNTQKSRSTVADVQGRRRPILAIACPCA